MNNLNEIVNHLLEFPSDDGGDDDDDNGKQRPQPPQNPPKGGKPKPGKGNPEDKKDEGDENELDEGENDEKGGVDALDNIDGEKEIDDLSEDLTEAENDIRKISPGPGGPMRALNDILGADSLITAFLFSLFLRKINELGQEIKSDSSKKESLFDTLIKSFEEGYVSRERVPARAAVLDEISAETSLGLGAAGMALRESVRSPEETRRKVDFTHISLFGLDTSGSMHDYILNEINRNLKQNMKEEFRIGDILESDFNIVVIENQEEFKKLLESLKENIQSIDANISKEEIVIKKIQKMLIDKLASYKNLVRVDVSKFLSVLVGGVYANTDYFKDAIPYFTGIVNASEFENYAAMTCAPYIAADGSISVNVKDSPFNANTKDFVHLSKIIGRGNDNMYEVGRMYGRAAKRVILSILLYKLYISSTKVEETELPLYNFIFNLLHVTDFIYDLEKGFITGFYDELTGKVSKIQDKVEAIRSITKGEIDVPEHAQEGIRRLRHYLVGSHEEGEGEGNLMDFLNHKVFEDLNLTVKDILDHVDGFSEQGKGFEVKLEDDENSGLFTFYYDGRKLGKGLIGINALVFFSVEPLRGRDGQYSAIYHVNNSIAKFCGSPLRVQTVHGRSLETTNSEFLKNQVFNRNDIPAKLRERIIEVFMPHKVVAISYEENAIKELLLLVKYAIIKYLLESGIKDMSNIKSLSDILKIFKQKDTEDKDAILQSIISNTGKYLTITATRGDQEIVIGGASLLEGSKLEYAHIIENQNTSLVELNADGSIKRIIPDNFYITAERGDVGRQEFHRNLENRVAMKALKKEEEKGGKTFFQYDMPSF
ncbi:hypothetical protein D6810_01500 [Candidatus Dojkabacteria bacterium]|uniref:Uncharacterized protein n=1 Tax=Candidatus Dojkabacteria bacterium TaxID=2099670 RepID=A0A3M0YZT9_9BACT|nr:MAG: hypothetical protein D6810_01500 [Candidatus Dojkabacteria bacterium]